MVGPLRLEGGVFGIAQSTPSGSLATLWTDAALGARLPIGGDFFFVPSAGGWLRSGPTTAPTEGAIDPDVWSRFDVDHRLATFGQLRLDYEPFLDLHFHARGRATSNADLASLDRAIGGVGSSAVIRRLRFDTGVDVERRFADADRMEAETRLVLRAAASFALWSSGPNRLSFLGFGNVRPGYRSDAFVGLSYDWTFGRGLADYAPDESAFSGQLGPYGEAQP